MQEKITKRTAYLALGLVAGFFTILISLTARWLILLQLPFLWLESIIPGPGIFGLAVVAIPYSFLWGLVSYVIFRVIKPIQGGMFNKTNIMNAAKEWIWYTTGLYISYIYIWNSIGGIWEHGVFL